MDNNDDDILAGANVLVNAPKEHAAGKGNAKYTHTELTSVVVSHALARMRRAHFSVT